MTGNDNDPEIGIGKRPLLFAKLPDIPFLYLRDSWNKIPWVSPSTFYGLNSISGIRLFASDSLEVDFLLQLSF